MLTDFTQEHTLKGGVAQVDITPNPGIPLTGFLARTGPSSGIHDHLFARALLLDVCGKQALLIACDLLALDSAFVSAVRSDIQVTTGIPSQSIMIACTHTHSGPATIFLQDCGDVDITYLTSLRQWLVEAAQKAVANLRKVKFGFGQGQFSKGVLNRRQPGKSIDPNLSVVGFKDETDQILALLVNYTCHPVCLDHTNRLISSDYPGYLAQSLQEQTNTIVLFTNGAAGDINPERMGNSFSFAEELGHLLAAEAQHILKTLEFHDTATLHVIGEMLSLPLNPLPCSDELIQSISEQQHGLVEAEADGNKQKGKLHKAMLGWAQTTLTRSLSGNLPSAIPAELQLICLGEVALLGIPGEAFNELGRHIKKISSMHQVLILGYTNNDIGYIPTQYEYALGGYEIDDAYKFYGYPAVLAPEAGDVLQQAAVRLLDSCPPQF